MSISQLRNGQDILHLREASSPEFVKACEEFEDQCSELAARINDAQQQIKKEKQDPISNLLLQ